MGICSSDRSLNPRFLPFREQDYKLDYSVYHPYPATKNYRMVKQVGSDGYSTMWEAERLDNPNVKRLIKVLKKDGISKEKIEAFKKEFSILKTIRHTNVATFREFYEDNVHFFVVTDISEGSNLIEMLSNDTMGEFGEEDVLNIMQQILTALDYCHNKKVVHKDFNLENIIVSKNSGIRHSKGVTVIDFGISLKNIPNRYFLSPETVETNELSF